MIQQTSHGDNSPNIIGDNNVTNTGNNIGNNNVSNIGDNNVGNSGDNNAGNIGNNNKNKNSIRHKVNMKKVAEYTIGGIIIAFLISFLASYLVSTCSVPSDEQAQTTQIEQ